MSTIGLPTSWIRSQNPTYTPLSQSYGATLDSSNVSSSSSHQYNLLARFFGKTNHRLILILDAGLNQLIRLLKFLTRTYLRAIRYALQRPSLPLRLLLLLLIIFATLIVIFILWINLFKASPRDACEVAEEFKRAFPPPSAPLPKLLHQQYKTATIPPDSDLMRWKKKFETLFPEVKHVLWTDVEMRKLVAEEYAFFLPHYDAYAHPIQRVDAARYFILHRYGGMYADLDYEPLANFWDLLPPDAPAFIESPYKYNERVQNSLMSSPPGHPFWNTTFELLAERSKRKDVLSSTGPNFVDEAVRRYSSSPVRVLPCEVFHRIPVGEEGAYSPRLAAAFREFLSMTPLVKSCGDVRSPRCQVGIHHNINSWIGSSWW